MVFVATLTASPIAAASSPAQLTQAERQLVVETIAKLVDEYYVFPETARKLSATLRRNLRTRTYDSITDPLEFEAKLDRDIRAVSQDNHFKVIFDPDWVTASRAAQSAEQKRAMQIAERAAASARNFGLTDVRLLDGGVGYLRLRSFENPEWTAETLGHAMRFLENADALIIDLRNNIGGYAELAQILCSYFFNSNDEFVMPLMEIRLRDRGKDIVIQQNVLSALHGPKMLTQDIYVLTNYRSFSAAEWTSFVLQNRKRATIVGERTIGGTHPTDQKIVSDRYSINVPFGTMVDAVTNTHFEGRGVSPDIEVPARDAVTRAQIEALTRLAAKHPDRRQNYEWHLQALRAQLAPVSVADDVLRSYVGTYGIVTLLWEDDRLVSLREGIKTRLTPIAPQLFALEGRDDARYRIRIEGGRPTAIERLFDDGRVLLEPKE